MPLWVLVKLGVRPPFRERQDVSMKITKHTQSGSFAYLAAQYTGVPVKEKIIFFDGDAPVEIAEVIEAGQLYLSTGEHDLPFVDSLYADDGKSATVRLGVSHTTQHTLAHGEQLAKCEGLA